MKKIPKPTGVTYTCQDYREEMILLGLKKQLRDKRLSSDERNRLLAEISRLEKLIGMQ